MDAKLYNYQYRNWMLNHPKMDTEMNSYENATALTTFQIRISFLTQV